MPFDFNWHDDEHTIIRVDIHGDTNWTEYHKVFDKIAKEVEAAPHRIDIILNDPDNRMPPGSPMPHIKATAQRLTAFPNMGVIVLVSNQSGSSLVKMLVSIVYRVYRIDTRIIGDFVNSLEEADKSIKQERTKSVRV